MKRRAFKLIVFLLAGAIINVAVAWTIAYRAESEPLGLLVSTVWSGSQKHHHGHLLSPYEYPHHAFVSVLYRNIAPRGSIEAYVAKHKRSPHFKADLIMPDWTYARRSQLGFDDPEISNLREDAAGWPCMASSCTIVMSKFSDSQYTVRGGIALSPLVSPSGWSQTRALPLRPIFPGFAINTIFYAAIVWMLFAVPGAVRRRVRIKRGQCASCGYSLRGNASETCPECGKLIEPRRSPDSPSVFARS